MEQNQARAKFSYSCLNRVTPISLPIRFPQAKSPGPALIPTPRSIPLPETHHPLHLLGHLVATQMVVEGALGSPVGRIVSNGVGSGAVHLGNHGFLFFLKSNRDSSVWGRRYGTAPVALLPETRTWPGRMQLWNPIPKAWDTWHRLL